jgi:hypothetical protein
MPLTTQSVPYMREPEVPDKKTDDKPDTTTEHKPAKTESKKLAPASGSTDEGVKNLAAERAVHAANGSTARVEEIDATLADLGYSAD